MGELSVQDGMVVAMEYTLTVDGAVVDSSQGHAPLEFLCGADNIIPGLEQAMLGMKLDESKRVVVAPADGYGEVDPQAFADVPRGEFPSEIPLEIGVELQVRTPSGQPLYARIAEVGAESVRLDFNHPLAGKTLHFDVKVVGLRSATDEELDHGHAHGGGHSH